MAETNDSTVDLEELISWHIERAAWYENARAASDGDRQAFYRLRRRHEDTADLLAQLSGILNDSDCLCPHACCEEIKEETPLVAGKTDG